MLRRKGFTLIELMVVVLIVAILAAVAIPVMRGRIDSAKWSEGKSMMGTISSALRAYQAERGEGVAANQGPQPGVRTTDGTPNLGFLAGDLTGSYFNSGDFTITAYANPVGGPFTYTITCIPSATNKPNHPTTVTLTVGATGVAVWGETF